MVCGDLDRRQRGIGGIGSALRGPRLSAERPQQGAHVLHGDLGPAGERPDLRGRHRGRRPPQAKRAVGPRPVAMGRCTEHATVKALAALDAGADAATLTARAENVARLVDGSRLLHLNSYLTFHDAVVGRLLIAAGRPEQARERLEMALRHGEETGMRFQDAELMRLRAHTFTEPRERHHALTAALECARHQGATSIRITLSAGFLRPSR